ncbi:hypothetical protein BRADI_4g03293v3 [Brachypodium distachyon]|uniref:Secreted protein n=1 Tax=Brachypodium distachyon TaxID=15368 RepID=A0A0Q3GYX8_BRADI|nr:hypothetical protein BRADI_4g03293v3 [Brachypodium distachyon]
MLIHCWWGKMLVGSISLCTGLFVGRECKIICYKSVASHSPSQTSRRHAAAAALDVRPSWSLRRRPGHAQS